MLEGKIDEACKESPLLVLICLFALVTVWKNARLGGPDIFPDVGDVGVCISFEKAILCARAG